MLAKTIRRLISLLDKLGVIESYQMYEYKEQFFSLNDIYNSGHWRQRSNIKKKYREIFGEFIKKNDIPSMDNFSAVFMYNSRHDVDNITGMEKMFIDALKAAELIPDDGKRFYKLYCVVYDDKLPMNTLNIYLIKNGSKK